MMDAGRTPEMKVNFYQTTWCSNPEDSHPEVLNEHAVCSRTDYNITIYVY
jgi:hypothetical protein